MKKIFLIFLFLINSYTLFPIEIEFIKHLDEVDYNQYRQEALKRSNHMIHGIQEISWIAKNLLLYERDSVFVIHDTLNDDYVVNQDIGKVIGSRFVSINPAEGSDFVVIDSGDYRNQNYWIYSNQFGIRELGSYNILNSLKDKSMVISEKRGIGSYWEKSLLGGYSIVNAVVAVGDNTYFHEGEEFAVALKAPGTEELMILPQEYHSARNNGNYSMTAVSFDRFRLAIFSGVILKEEYNGPRWKIPLESGILVFNIEYEGTLLSEEKIYKSPSFDSDVIGLIEHETVVKVSEADNYEVLESGKEDFWYYIEASHLSGWLHGTALLIENQTWQDRLEIRGPVLNWSQIEEVKK